MLSKLEETLALTVQQVEMFIVKTFEAEGKVQSCNLVNLAIMTKDGITWFFHPAICEPITGQPVTVALERFPHLLWIDLADCGNTADKLDITILVGADNYWNLVTGRIHCGGDGPTVLGWVLSGPIPHSVCQEDTVNLLAVHALEVEASAIECSNCALDQRQTEFWTLQTLGIQENESSVYDLFMQGIKFESGRYSVHISWKDLDLPLSNNFDLCQQRLCNLHVLKRLHLEPRMLQEYDIP